jgi:hypothetical protein
MQTEEMDYDEMAGQAEGQRMAALFDEHEEVKARSGGFCLAHGRDCGEAGTEDF